MNTTLAAMPQPEQEHSKGNRSVADGPVQGEQETVSKKARRARQDNNVERTVFRSWDTPSQEGDQMGESARFATYRDTGLPCYRGNPFIEALPPILSEVEAMQALQQLPQFRNEDRELPAHLRLHIVQDALRLQFFAPLPTHLRVEQRLSRAIRGGYTRRNPLVRGFYQTLNGNVDAVAEALMDGRPVQSWSPSLGFYVAGIPGMGKTMTVRRILATYPQVIEHRKYKAEPFCFRQVTHLMIQCPSDASTRSLCVNFLQAMDQLLGTNYWRQYTKRSVNPSKMALMPQMARVAALHGLGVLVVDEIQRLSRAASGGAEEMLNFFAQLVDVLGVPVVLIGTIKALPILAAQFHQARRAADQGDLIWDRMSRDGRDGEWRLLTDYMWPYQYTRKFAPLTEELRLVLYEETAGITDLAVKVFMLAQCYAMSEGDEELTSGIIRRVARTNLQMAQPALEAIRRGDARGLVDYEDMHPQILKRFLREYRDEVDVVGVSSVPSSGKSDTLMEPAREAKQEQGKAVNIGPRSEEELGADAVRGARVADIAEQEHQAIAAARTQSGNKSKRNRAKQNGSGLPGIVERGAKVNLSAHAALEQANYISPKDEFSTDTH